ncbi:MAG: hypothetical protein ABL886_01810 [Rhodoglobus sp.]
MKGIARVLRGVVLSALVVSTILVGAISFHEMSQGSHAAAEASHTMAASIAAATAVTAVAVVHDHGSGASAAHLCGGECDQGHVIVGVLCVAAGVAMLLMILWPRPTVAGGILTSLASLLNAARGTIANATTPSLTQLSICRT